MLRVNTLSGFGRRKVSAGAVTYVATGSFESGSTSITPTLPSGWAENDIFVFIGHSQSSPGISCAGWTAAPDAPLADLNDITVCVLYRRATSSESNPTMTSAGHGTGAIMAFRGCPTSGSPWDVTAGSVNNAHGTSAVIPGVTTSLPNCMIIAAIGTSHDLSSSAIFSGWTNANLASIDERIDGATTTGSGGAIGAAQGAKLTAGATGNTTATVAGGADFNRLTYWCGALKGA